MYIYTYKQPMESQIESLPKVRYPQRAPLEASSPQGYIRSPVAQWYGRGQRQEPGCRSMQIASPKWFEDMAPENGDASRFRKTRNQGISVAIKKVFHMGGFFRFPSGIITKKKKSICHGSKIWFQHVPTIKN